MNEAFCVFLRWRRAESVESVLQFVVVQSLPIMVRSDEDYGTRILFTYYHFKRSIVTRPELIEYGKMRFGTGHAVLSFVAKDDKNKNQNKIKRGVYRLPLEEYGVAVNPLFSRHDRSYAEEERLILPPLIASLIAEKPSPQIV